MKVVLLHGPAINSSRIKLVSIKKEFKNEDIVIFEKGADAGEVLNNLSSASLFTEERLVVLENPSEEFTFDLSLSTDHLSLIFWFDHEVSAKKPIMDWVKKNEGQILFFPEGREISIFPFLDLLALGDKKAFIELEKLKNAGFEIQYFLTMVFYLLRNLAVTPKNAPEFVKNKLKNQRRRFDLQKIKSLYKDILEIDFKIKSGLLEIPQAEFILVNKFVS